MYDTAAALPSSATQSRRCIESPRLEVVSGAPAAQAPARCYQTLEERSGTPARAAARREPLHGRDHALEAGLFGPVHRTAPPGGEAVAVDVHDIDVARAQRNALLHDARALVDQRMQQPLENLLVGDAAPLDAELARDLLDERHHLGVGDARAAFVTVVAAARLLAEPASGDEPLERSEERRVGKECRYRWSREHEKKKAV